MIFLPCKSHLILIYNFSFALKIKSGSSAGDDGETLEVTVYDYFVKHRNIEIKASMYMPCLDVGKPKRPNYLPLEVLAPLPPILTLKASNSRNSGYFSFWDFQLCSLVSLQRYTKALSAIQRASLVEKSRQKPPERIRVVTDVSSYIYFVFLFCLLLHSDLTSFLNLPGCKKLSI